MAETIRARIEVLDFLRSGGSAEHVVSMGETSEPGDGIAVTNRRGERFFIVEGVVLFDRRILIAQVFAMDQRQVKELARLETERGIEVLCKRMMG